MPTGAACGPAVAADIPLIHPAEMSYGCLRSLPAQADPAPHPVPITGTGTPPLSQPLQRFVL